MTYLEGYHSAQADINLSTPYTAVNATKALGWMTEAMNQYQMKTRVMREICLLDLDPTSTDGIYDIGFDIAEIDKIDYVPPSDATPPATFPVNIVDFDYFVRYQQSWRVTPVPVPGTGNGQFIGETVLPGERPTNINAARYGDCKLWLSPIALDGQLKLYTVPYFLPYTPSAKGRWSAFGFPPDEVMSVRQIPKEFNAVWEGIKGYVIDKMLGAIDPTDKIYTRRRAEGKAAFTQGLDYLVSMHAPRNVNVRPRPRLGPVG